eukprot:gene3887-12067_t
MEGNLEKMVKMGFRADAASAMLASTGNNLDMAVDRMVGGDGGEMVKVTGGKRNTANAALNSPNVTAAPATAASIAASGPSHTPSASSAASSSSDVKGKRQRPGDWLCPVKSCGDLVFGYRTACHLCGAPKPGYKPGEPAPPGGKPGDWICPKKNCRDLVFARRNKCNRCGTARPPRLQPTLIASGVAPPPAVPAPAAAAPPPPPAVVPKAAPPPPSDGWATVGKKAQAAKAAQAAHAAVVVSVARPQPTPASGAHGGKAGGINSNNGGTTDFPGISASNLNDEKAKRKRRRGKRGGSRASDLPEDDQLEARAHNRKATAVNLTPEHINPEGKLHGYVFEYASEELLTAAFGTMVLEAHGEHFPLLQNVCLKGNANATQLFARCFDRDAIFGPFLAPKSVQLLQDTAGGETLAQLLVEGETAELAKCPMYSGPITEKELAGLLPTTAAEDGAGTDAGAEAAAAASPAEAGATAAATAGVVGNEVNNPAVQTTASAAAAKPVLVGTTSPAASGAAADPFASNMPGVGAGGWQTNSQVPSTNMTNMVSGGTGWDGASSNGGGNVGGYGSFTGSGVGLGPPGLSGHLDGGQVAGSSGGGFSGMDVGMGGMPMGGGSMSFGFDDMNAALPPMGDVFGVGGGTAPQTATPAPTMAVLAPDQDNKITICWVDGSTFWVHEESNRRQLTAMEAEIGDMVASPTALIFSVEPPVSSLCVAEKANNGGPFEQRLVSRVVIKQRQGDQVEVEYVDYGYTERISGAMLHPLPSKFNNVPALAVPCRLVGLEQLVEQDPAFMQKKMVVEELLSGGRFYCTVVSVAQDGVTEVKLMDSSSQLVAPTIAEIIRQRLAPKQPQQQQQQTADGNHGQPSQSVPSYSQEQQHHPHQAPQSGYGSYSQNERRGGWSSQQQHDDQYQNQYAQQQPSSSSRGPPQQQQQQTVVAPAHAHALEPTPASSRDPSNPWGKK